MQFFQRYRRFFLIFTPLAILLLAAVLLLPRMVNMSGTLNGPAPNGSWNTSSWAPSNNTILGTAADTTSDVWFTGSNGIVGEVFYPTADIPNTTALEFLVGDSGHSWVDEEEAATSSQVKLYNNHALAWIVTNTAKNGKYSITKIIYTDPGRDSLIQQVTFKALKGSLADYLLYVYYNPALHDKGDNNRSSTQVYNGKTMLVTTNASGDYASALAASIPFVTGMTSSGFVDLNDGLTDLKGPAGCGSSRCPDYTMNYTYSSAGQGNTAQMGLLDFSAGGSTNTTTITFNLVLSFGSRDDAGNIVSNGVPHPPLGRDKSGPYALEIASLVQQRQLATSIKDAGTPAVTRAERALTGTLGDKSNLLASYVSQWNSFDGSLKPAPAVGQSAEVQQAREQEYYLAANVLKAAQDKRSGAFVAGLGTPWGMSNGDDDAGGYHLVWERDMYEFASALIVAGDTADPRRALQWAFNVQQEPDGHFPQNSYVDGTPYFTGMQKDEQAFPIMLAWKLGVTDSASYTRHIRLAANYIVAHGPATGQDRWEENGGYSPSTIAAEISGLVCAADIARINGDSASQKRFIATADYYQKNVVKWTYTTTGDFGSHHYFERIDDDGNPNDGGLITIGNHGGAYDERDVVDMGFLELVRHGDLPANSPYIISSLPVVDAQISQEINGNRYWFRYNHDGYGEHDDGSSYDGSGTGRLWPIFSGERGIYTVAEGGDADPYITAMMAARNSAGMIPEQIWDNKAPAGYTPGTPTGSMNPLNWAMGEFITLLVSASEHRIADVVQVVFDRYAK